jgi:hypothetical protein
MLIKESESKSASSAEAWHPDFLGNLDLPEAERAGFMVRALSGREIERIKRDRSKQHYHQSGYEKFTE